MSKKTRAPKRHFRPWRKDFYIAIAFGVTGLLVLGAALLGYRALHNYFVASLGMLCVPFMYYGFVRLDRGLSRKRGKTIEDREKHAFKSLLPDGWCVLPDIVMPSGGDIDIPIRLPRGEIVVIDIKTFRYWVGFARKKKAIAQIRRQKKYMNTKWGVIWLPAAGESRRVQFYQEIMIVSGRIKFLFNCIEDILEYSVTIRFPAKPSDHLLQFIKLLGFRWNRADLSWNGLLARKHIKELKAQVMAAGGSLDIADEA